MLLAGVLAGAAPSGAATWHVAAGAPEGGDGSVSLPFARIAPAMAAAAAGDTVRLGPGTYSDTVATTAYGNPRLALLVLAEGVVVAGAGPGATILHALPADTLTFGVTAADVGPASVVRDLSITGACFHGVNTRTASPTLVNLEIRTDLVGRSSTAADFRDGSDPVVADVVFDGGHSALFVEFGSTGTFTGCTIAGRVNDGVSVTRADPTFIDCVFEPAGRDVILLNGGSRPSFTGCTIADGGRWAVRVTGYPAGTVLDLSGNTWFSDDPGVIATRILDAADDPSLGATVVVEPLSDPTAVETLPFGSLKSLYR
jgi:hypothetical protein